MITGQTFRYWLLFIVLTTLCVLLTSVYFEYAMGLLPCPLCLMQRFGVLLFLAASLSALYFGLNPAGKKVAIIQAIIAIAGLFFAGRQLWLQSLPADLAPACMPGIDILIHYFPWQDVAKALFWGAGDCAEVEWQWFGIPIAGWSAIYFVWMIITSLCNYFIIKAWCCNSESIRSID